MQPSLSVLFLSSPLLRAAGSVTSCECCACLHADAPARLPRGAGDVCSRAAQLPSARTEDPDRRGPAGAHSALSHLAQSHSALSHLALSLLALFHLALKTLIYRRGPVSIASVHSHGHAAYPLWPSTLSVARPPGAGRSVGALHRLVTTKSFVILVCRGRNALSFGVGALRAFLFAYVAGLAWCKHIATIP